MPSTPNESTAEERRRKAWIQALIDTLPECLRGTIWYLHDGNEGKAILLALMHRFGESPAVIAAAEAYYDHLTEVTTELYGRNQPRRKE